MKTKNKKVLSLFPLFLAIPDTSYFSIMSKKGRHINQIGTAAACFERGEREEWLYGVMFDDKMRSEAIISEYEKGGWQHCASGQNYLIFRTKEQNLCETPYKDSEKTLIAESYKKQRSTVLVGLLLCVAVMLVIAFLLLKLVSYKEKTFDFGFLLFCELFFLRYIILLVVSLFYLSKFKRNVLENHSNRSLGMNVSWFAFFRISGIIAYFGLGLALLIRLCELFYVLIVR